jgi:hypothetical protein
MVEWLGSVVHVPEFVFSDVSRRRLLKFLPSDGLTGSYSGLEVRSEEAKFHRRSLEFHFSEPRFVANGGLQSSHAKNGGTEGTLARFTAANVWVMGVRARIPGSSSSNLLLDN